MHGGIALKLTMTERIQAFALLPERGDVATLRTLRGLAERLALSEEEKRLYGVVTSQTPRGATHVWNDLGKTAEFDLEFTPAETALVVESLKALEAEKRLPLGCLTLWEKFMEP